MKVCILAAGLGSRLGEISDYLHKALLPLGNEAVLSHIIRCFPKDSEFVIALGNKSEQIKAFVQLVHPELKVSFVNVDPYMGPGAGPGFSLYSCREYLQEPFIFTACDTLISDPIPSSSKNWMGVAKVSDPQNWCTVITDNKFQVLDLEYKNKESVAQLAFSGIAHIHDYKLFWECLKTPTDINKEIQVNDGLSGLVVKGIQAFELSWSDTGNWASYEQLLQRFDKNLTFLGKTTEFTYQYADRIVKIYNSKEKAIRCFERAKAMKDSAPEMVGQSDSVLVYRYVEGDLLSHHLSGIECTKFLEWIQDTLWEDKEVDQAVFRKTLHDFYIEKTLGRLKLLKDKQAGVVGVFDKSIRINGLLCQPVNVLLESIKKFVVEDGIPSTFHGDLHADNVIKTKKGYKLIDWRDSFCESTVGDRYYDLGKFLHTIDLSVKTMDKCDFQIKGDSTDIQINHSTTFQDMDSRETFLEFLEKYKYDRKKTEIINALVFLNMSPLYDRELGLYLYYLGLYQLQKSLS